MNPLSPVTPARKPRYLLLASLTLLWLLALIPGVRSLLAFENTVGRQGLAPSDWHSSALSSGDARLPILLVALHPKCSCSNATLTELEEAVQNSDRPYNAILLIDPPQGISFDWKKIAAYREAQRALHATVILDSQGKLAASFGAFTSGDVLLYSAEDSHARRHLLFAGGVTGSRGMVGENHGEQALEAVFHDPDMSPQTTAPVFGCGLLNTASPADKPRRQ